jgi:short-subunit dehydrogenase
MYPATKAFLVAFSQALHHELHSQGIRVQALCPGFTYTEFHDVASKDRSVVPKFLWMSAEQVVRASLKALPRGQVICVPGWHYRLITSLARIPLTASIIQFFASQTAIRRRIRP